MYIGGSFGAQLCSEKFCSSVHKDLSVNLLISSTAIAPAPTSATPDMTTTPTITPTFEAQLCESIYKTSKLLNRELKSRSKTGTTMTSLFIHQNQSHNSDPSTPNNTYSYTIYCANIGDSRCIMLYNNAVTPLSYDHNLNNECEMRRIGRHEAVPWIPKAYKIIPNTCTSSKKEVNNSLLKKTKAGYTLENTTAHELSCDDNDIHIDTFSLTPSGHNSDPSPPITPDLDEDNDLIKLPIIHAQSFISQRVSNKGVPTGPIGMNLYKCNLYNLYIHLTVSDAYTCLCYSIYIIYSILTPQIELNM